MNKIREVYKEHVSALERGIRLSPYGLGITWEFSYIEDIVWGDIRYLGLPLYPQFPVLNYFIDFGDPKRKIGIEVDSRQWHKDKEKDKIRQRRIENTGWRIYRIKSRCVYKQKRDFLIEESSENEDERIVDERFYKECSEGILRKIYEPYWEEIHQMIFYNFDPIDFGIMK